MTVHVPLHPIITDAATGVLPSWSQPSRPRYEHMLRVSALMGAWADALELSPHDRTRWRAVGLLHDALREVKPGELRPLVAEPLRDVAGKVLHGPAAATRFRELGIDDEPLLAAITYHTIGHPSLDVMGRALFIADNIEPARRHDPARLAELRALMPHALHDVLVEVTRSRIDKLLRDSRPIRAETAAFWNDIVGDARG